MKIYYDTLKYMDSVYHLKWKVGSIPKVSQIDNKLYRCQ